MTRQELSCATLTKVITYRDTEAFTKKLKHLETLIQKTVDVMPPTYSTVRCTPLPKEIAIASLSACEDSIKGYRDYMTARDFRSEHAADILGYNTRQDLLDLCFALHTTRETADIVLQEYVYRFLYDLTKKLLKT